MSLSIPDMPGGRQYGTFVPRISKQATTPLKNKETTPYMNDNELREEIERLKGELRAAGACLSLIFATTLFADASTKYLIGQKLRRLRLREVASDPVRGGFEGFMSRLLHDLPDEFSNDLSGTTGTGHDDPPSS